FIKSPVLCCGENITFHQVAKFSVPLHTHQVGVNDGCLMHSVHVRCWYVLYTQVIRQLSGIAQSVTTAFSSCPLITLTVFISHI
ncbi:hypothetical protein C9175_04970, partial [Escherichia coli]